MHVLPGLNYYVDEEQEFWHTNFTSRFVQIISEYEDKVTLISAAHIHRAEFKNPVS